MLHSKRDALSSNQNVDGSRLTSSALKHVIHDMVTRKDTGDGIVSARN